MSVQRCSSMQHMRRYCMVSPFLSKESTARVLVLGVHHPEYAEPIDAHAETFRPESLLIRHDGRAILRESLEDPLSVGGAVDAERRPRALRLFIAAAVRVRAHHRLAADAHA